MKYPFLLIGILIVFFIVIIFYNSVEYFNNPVVLDRAFIKLYQNFNNNAMIFDYEPVLDWPTGLYYKQQFRGVVKSIDLNLPKKNDGLDIYRTIELWSVYGGTNISSEESDFYDPYMEPHLALKANSGKYQLIAKIEAGSRIKLNLTIPVNRVMIYAKF